MQAFVFLLRVHQTCEPMIADKPPVGKRTLEEEAAARLAHSEEKQAEEQARCRERKARIKELKRKARMNSSMIELNEMMLRLNEAISLTRQMITLFHQPLPTVVPNCTDLIQNWRRQRPLS